MREAVGDSVDIMIEAHDRFGVAAAVEIGNWLAEFEPTWFETPVPSNDVKALISVAKRVPVRVIAGERMHEFHDFARFLDADITDIINPEPLGVGGIWRTLQMAALAQAHHVELALHNAESPLKTMVTLQICAITPNIFIQECFDDFLEPWTGDVLKGFVRVKDGTWRFRRCPAWAWNSMKMRRGSTPTRRTTSCGSSSPAGNGERPQATRLPDRPLCRYRGSAKRSRWPRRTVRRFAC